MAGPLSPKQAADVATSVYALQNSSDMGSMADGSVSVLGEFDIDKGTRIAGRSGIGPASSTTGFAMFAEGKGIRKGEALVAVRGTASMHDALTDIFTRVEQGATGAGVHAGFSRSYDSISAALDGRFGGANKPLPCVHVVGHSLGGAIATIAAARLARQGHKVKLYTFGSPRTGLGLFATEATSRIGAANIFRVHHDADPVTMIPLFPFIHAPTSGSHYNLDWRSGVVDVEAHFMDNYKGSLGQSSWAALANATSHAETVADIEAWLEFAATSVAPVIPMNTRMLSLVGQAINWMIQLAGGLAIGLAAGIEFVTDQIAALLMKAAALAKKVGTILKNLMIVIMKLLGRTYNTAQDLTTAFVHWVLQLLFNRLGAMALQAARRVL